MAAAVNKFRAETDRVWLVPQSHIHKYPDDRLGAAGAKKVQTLPETVQEEELFSPLMVPPPTQP